MFVQKSARMHPRPAPKLGEIRYGKVDLNESGKVHKYTGVHPYLIVSNDTYNKYSGQCEAIPFTTKRYGSTNPVHVLYKLGEVEGLDRDSTLVIEGRDTLRNEQLSDPVGKFTPENWVRAVQAMIVQCPVISSVMNANPILAPAISAPVI